MASAVPLCPDLEAFMEILNMAVDYSMEHEITEMVKSAIFVMVETEVYRKYTPKVYVRQGPYGGLQDRGNMEAKYERQTKTLTVQNVRDDWETKDWRWRQTGDPDNTVADIVENGGPWSWKVHIEPRPFHEPAERFLIDGGYVDNRLSAEVESNLSGWSY